jgi:hypothetical protein
MDVTMTKGSGKIRVELHTELAVDWWMSVMDSDFVHVGGSVYLVAEKMGEGLARMMREHGGLEVEG